jgi:MFS family permease
MTASHTFALSALGIVFLNIGCVLAGLLVDRIGAWRTVMLYSLLLPLGIGVLYACLISGGDWVGLAYAVAGLGCGVVGAVPSVMVSLFPARVRVSGISFTYNIAYAAWASITPLLLIGLMPWSPWICVIFCAVMGAVGVGSAAYFGTRMPKIAGSTAAGAA